MARKGAKAPATAIGYHPRRTMTAHVARLERRPARDAQLVPSGVRAGSFDLPHNAAAIWNSVVARGKTRTRALRFRLQHLDLCYRAEQGSSVSRSLKLPN